MNRNWNKDWRKSVIVLSGGFDPVHKGHLRMFREASWLGHQVVVGLNSDASVQQIKGPNRPIHSQSFRATMLMALKPVDAVVIFSEDTPIKTLEIIQPDIHVKGGDYVIEELPEYNIIQSYGSQIKILSFFYLNLCTFIH